MIVFRQTVVVVGSSGNVMVKPGLGESDSSDGELLLACFSFNCLLGTLALLVTVTV